MNVLCVLLLAIGMGIASEITSRKIWPNKCPSGFTEFAKFCYKTEDNSVYPYDCPYKDVSSFNDYYNIILEVLAIIGIKAWVDIRQDPDYGYYMWKRLGDDYGTLFSKSAQGSGECVSLTGKIASESFTAESCDVERVGFCVYPKQSSRKNYCEAYNEICNTNKDCHCKSNRIGYFCETACSETILDDGCSECESKFEQYPEPKITLSYDNKDLLATVENVLKLRYITNNNVVYCFTEVYDPSDSLIYYKYKDSEVTKSKTSEDTIVYKFSPKNLGPGNYWCEGFTYPNLEVIQSNRILVKGDYGLNFALNLTIEIDDSIKFLPFNLHTKAETEIRKRLDESKILSVRPIEFSKFYENGNKIDVLVHLTTKSEFNLNQIQEINVEIIESVQKLIDDDKMFKLNSFSNSEYCIGDMTIVNEIEIEWPTTAIGKNAIPNTLILQNDGQPLTRSCKGSFRYGSEWSEIEGDVDFDEEISETTAYLHDLLNSNKSTAEKNRDLHSMLLKSETFTIYDIYLIAEIFHQIVRSEDEYEFNILTDSLSLVTKIDRGILSESQRSFNSTDSLLYAFDIGLSKTNPSSIITDNVIVQIADLQLRKTVGIAIYQNGEEISTIELTKGVSIEEIDQKNLIFATFIPEILLEEILDSSEDRVNLITAIYLNEALFNEETKTKQSSGTIVSMFIEGFDTNTLSDFFPVIFDSTTSTNKEKHCGYWNYGIDELWMSFSGHWMIDPEAEFNMETESCSFNHMTHFALLVGAEEDAVINYLSIIGSVLTLISVCLIFLTALISKSWRESGGTKILLNFCLAIALQMILLIVLDFVDSEENEEICMVLGICLHYVVISQFLWALVISYLQYRKFVQVLVNEPDRIVLKSVIFAWGLAIIPVLISSCMDISNYYLNGNCYPSNYYLFIGVYLPIIFIVSTNIFMFVLIFQNVLYKKTTAFGKEKNLILLRIKLGVILFFLMGFSWIFGLLGSFLDSPALLYIFCFTTAVQGLVLYMYFVVWNKATRRLWTKQFRKVRKNANTQSMSQSDSHNKKY